MSIDAPITPDRTANLRLDRRFTIPGVHPYDEVDFELRDTVIKDLRTGSEAFRQNGVEFPRHWSVNAGNIVAQKYFRGAGAEREHSLRQIIDRVVGAISSWGQNDGYFLDDEERTTFEQELTYLLLHQRVSFNSPVWFNIGVAGVPQQASACFILSVDDSLDSILNWYREEGVIFKGGSGAGANLSKIRSSREQLSGGGVPSGPVSFMRGADASAGTIKSGGTTRRAAKMVVLDVSHPDISEFIWCKAREEAKSRALQAAGFDMGIDGRDAPSIQYQNANNSVRLSDEFMQAVEDAAPWPLRAVTDGHVIETVDAASLFHEIAQAAWECADPGVQFDTTINRWHTAAATAPINASNPCSEYMHVDDSACNLASLNLLTFLGDDGVFDVDGFRHAVRVTIMAQEILVQNAAYPTSKIAENSLKFRQLGLGYANLGALLMALGMAYDSEEGRSMAAVITAVMTGAAYATSVDLARRMGPFAGFEENRSHMLRVLAQHQAAVDDIDLAAVPEPLAAAARSEWATAYEGASRFGVRNAQATVLAPTGTISFMMDCDTTGIEPDLGLNKTKKLVGGGTMSIVNQTVGRALKTLGYSAEQAAEIEAWIEDHHSVVGAPHLQEKHVAVFATSMGDNTIGWSGHVDMMAACQPFLSGAISKTVNLPETATVEDIEQLLMQSWRHGLKAVAIYRDNCKVGQPLTTSSESAVTADAASVAAAVSESVPIAPVRERLPRSRTSRTIEFRVADCKGFVTVGEYADGRPGELFVRVSKQGSTLAGIMDAFAIAVSHGLQYGVPLSAYVRAFVGMRFEPAGMTDDPEVRIANSLMDYLFRRLAIEYLDPKTRAELNIFTMDERTQPTLPGVEEAAAETSTGLDLQPPTPSTVPSAAPASDPSAPMCMQCGVQMVRAGSCHVCGECGTTSGCS